MNEKGPIDAAHDQGYVTSACFSPNLGHAIAIGFLKDGDLRLGEKMRLVSPLTGIETKIEIVSAHFIDPTRGTPSCIVLNQSRALGGHRTPH